MQVNKLLRSSKGQCQIIVNFKLIQYTSLTIIRYIKKYEPEVENTLYKQQRTGNMNYSNQ